MAKPNPMTTLGKSLSAVVTKAGKGDAPVPPPAPRAAVESAPAGARTKQASRAGRVMIGGFFDPQAHKQLRMLGIELGKTTQEMLTEMMDTYFAEHNKPQIARMGQESA